MEIGKYRNGMICYDHSKGKDKRRENNTMPGKEEIAVVRKATVYDLQKIFEKSEKESFTAEEIKELMDAYVSGAD